MGKSALEKSTTAQLPESGVPLLFFALNFLVLLSFLLLSLLSSEFSAKVSRLLLLARQELFRGMCIEELPFRASVAAILYRLLPGKPFLI
jgi:hypothetical protein